jgi:hypothetical protein
LRIVPDFRLQQIISSFLNWLSIESLFSGDMCAQYQQLGPDACATSALYDGNGSENPPGLGDPDRSPEWSPGGDSVSARGCGCKRVGDHPRRGLAGLSASAVATVVRLLDRYPTLPIDRSIADLAANLRRQNRWRLPDAFQAAAQFHGLRLATRNSRDFPPQRHAFVVVPYALPAVK